MTNSVSIIELTIHVLVYSIYDLINTYKIMHLSAVSYVMLSYHSMPVIMSYDSCHVMYLPSIRYPMTLLKLTKQIRPWNTMHSKQKSTQRRKCIANSITLL